MYGGRKSTIPACLSNSVTSSTWCTEQLSIMTMDSGFMPLNSIMFGINDALRKSKNLSPFTVSVVRSGAIFPVEDIAMMALALLPLVNSRCYSALIPHREYPYFRIASLVVEPV